MKRRKRKIHKKGRGTRTVFRGNTKKGRGRGSRMGNPSVKSKGGGGERNIQHVYKKQRHRLLERKGFTSIKKKPRAINLKDLDYSQKEIDVTKMGYEKVLGAGEVLAPVTIIAKFFTQKAIEKIEKAGGKAMVKQ